MDVPGATTEVATLKRALSEAENKAAKERTEQERQDARAGPFGHRGFAGDESVRRSVSAPVEGAARARNRAWG